MSRLLIATACLSAMAAPALARPNLLEAVPTPTPPPLPGLERTLPPASGSFVFYEDFERGAGRWALTGGQGTLGWHLLKAKTCGGEFTMHLGGPEVDAVPLGPAEGFVTLRAPIDLRKSRRPVLKFDVKGLAQPYAAASYQAEVKGRTGGWKALGPRVDGRFGLVRSIYLDLAPYAGQAVSLRFRGRLAAGAAPSKGLYLDDVQVIEAMTR